MEYGIGMRQDILYRIPDREPERNEITHKLPKDMTRRERRAVQSELRRAAAWRSPTPPPEGKE